jgi:DNA topoisomerase IB
MSSSVHARVRTVDKDSILEAAKALNIDIQERENGELTYKGTSFKFDANGNVDVKYYKDHMEENKKTKQLTQLGTYFTSVRRLNKAGLKCTKSVNDAVMAVQANQKLVLEFEEAEAASEEQVSS